MTIPPYIETYYAVTVSVALFCILEEVHMNLLFIKANSLIRFVRSLVFWCSGYRNGLHNIDFEIRDNSGKLINAVVAYHTVSMTIWRMKATVIFLCLVYVAFI